jgi:hypothetical protein
MSYLSNDTTRAAWNHSNVDKEIAVVFLYPSRYLYDCNIGEWQPKSAEMQGKQAIDAIDGIIVFPSLGYDIIDGIDGIDGIIVFPSLGYVIIDAIMTLMAPLQI